MPSKPNLLSFSVAVGVFENKTAREFRDLLDQKFATQQVPFSRLAILIFEMLMAHAATNQVDGDYSAYSDQMFYEQIFAPKFIAVGLGIPTPAQVSDIVALLTQTFIDEEGRIRSWAGYQPHLVKHKKTIVARRKAGEKSGKAREALRLKRLKDLAKLETTEYGTKGAPNGRIEWNGKLFFPNELEKVVKSLEAEVQKKKAETDNARDEARSANRDVSSDKSHNVCYI